VELRLGLCKTRTVLDYRLVIFSGDLPRYVKVRSADGREAVARVERWQGCVGVSRELALRLYPYYGWGRMLVEALFQVEPTEPQPASRVVMTVPFGISEAVVRRQLTGFPLVEGAVALEYLEHVEFGEIAHVEPPMSILTDSTAIKLFEKPVDDEVVVFGPRLGKKGGDRH
jgi:hypothetical protein